MKEVKGHTGSWNIKQGHNSSPRGTGNRVINYETKKLHVLVSRLQSLLCFLNRKNSFEHIPSFYRPLRKELWHNFTVRIKISRQDYQNSS